MTPQKTISPTARVRAGPMSPLSPPSNPPPACSRLPRSTGMRRARSTSPCRSRGKRFFPSLRNNQPCSHRTEAFNSMDFWRALGLGFIVLTPLHAQAPQPAHFNSGQETTLASKVIGPSGGAIEVRQTNTPSTASPSNSPPVPCRRPPPSHCLRTRVPFPTSAATPPGPISASPPRASPNSPTW